MLFQLRFGLDQHVAGLAALAGTYYTGCFQLVHQPAGAVIAQFHAALQQRGRAYLALHDQAGGIFKQRVAVGKVEFLSF